MSEIIDLCRKLVQIPSYSGDTDEIMCFLQKYLADSGFAVRLMEFANDQGKSAQSLCASVGNGYPHLLFVGHADVVVAGAISDWKFPPFGAVVDNDILYGRGIADMKGGLACFLQACKEFVKDGFKGKITIIISGDEEEPIVEGTRVILEKLEHEGEKFDFALVGEPSNPLNMGDEIKIGRRGDVVLNITSYGETGHTAYTDNKSNPVYNLVNLLYSMQHDKLDGGNQYFGPSIMHVTTFDVGNNASNVVPGKAVAKLDVRFNSEHSCESIEAWAKTHMQSVYGKFELRAEYIGQSFLSDIDDNIKELREIVKEHTGKYPKYSTSGGTSDARFVKSYCPVVEYGLTNATIHKINECEKVENIENLYKIYKDFLKKFFVI